MSMLEGQGDAEVMMEITRPRETIADSTVTMRLPRRVSRRGVPHVGESVRLFMMRSPIPTPRCGFSLAEKHMVSRRNVAWKCEAVWHASGARPTLATHRSC
jgi:hypothetical protein